MKKKIVFCLLGGVMVCMIVFCSIACLVDRNKIANEESPIFSRRVISGSEFVYLGPGYVIGTNIYDNNDGGDMKPHSWFWFAGGVIYENIRSISGVFKDGVNIIEKGEGLQDAEARKVQDLNSEEYIKYMDTLHNRGTGDVARIEPVEVETENEHFIKIYAFNENEEIVWEYQTQKEPLIQFYSVEFIEVDFWNYGDGKVIINDLGVLKALDLNTGKTIWAVDYNEKVNVGTYDEEGNVYVYSRFSNKFTAINKDGKIVKRIDIAKAEKDNNITEPCDKSDYVGIGRMDNHIINISVKHMDEAQTVLDEEEIYIDRDNNWSIKIERNSYIQK